jgi:hypothetical protein
MVKTADRNFIICLIETISNILKNKVPLKTGQRSRLRKHAKLLRKLSKVREEENARKILVQRGGSIIPLLIGPVLTALVSLIGK